LKEKIGNPEKNTASKVRELEGGKEGQRDFQEGKGTGKKRSLRQRAASLSRQGKVIILE